MNNIRRIFCTIFIIIISFFFITTINNNEKVSEVEKRKLITFPKFTIKEFANNNFFEKLTDAFSDQLTLRGSLIKGYYLFQFQRYNGKVVIGKNNELYAAIQKINNIEAYKSDLKDVTTSINEVADKVVNLNAKFIFLSIPRKDAVETENLPKSYISSSEIYKSSYETIKRNINKNVILIDGYEIFKTNKNENISYYYTADHHITPRGGALLYNEIINTIKNKQIKNHNIDDLYYVKKTIMNGSYNQQIGQSIVNKPEELCLIPKFNIKYVRYENGEKSNIPVFGQGNTYSKAYMGGDKAFTIVDTKRKQLPNILYVGSSFTNVLEALSIHDFNKMISIDYRHNKSGNSIEYYVKKYNINYVIFVPSQSNNALSSSMIKKHLGK